MYVYMCRQVRNMVQKKNESGQRYCLIPGSVVIRILNVSLHIHMTQSRAQWYSRMYSHRVLMRSSCRRFSARAGRQKLPANVNKKNPLNSENIIKLFKRKIIADGSNSYYSQKNQTIRFLVNSAKRHSTKWPNAEYNVMQPAACARVQCVCDAIFVYLCKIYILCALSDWKTGKQNCFAVYVL